MKRNQLIENLKDPMIIILAALLIFLTCGTAISGCRGRKTVIALDAAFGGEDTGYQGIINEADFTESVVEKLAVLLTDEGHFDVVLTHDASTSATVEDRVNKIKQDGADIVLSIHATGTPDATRNGQQIYADIPTKTTHDASLKLANCIHDAFTSDTWTPSVNYLYYQSFDDDSYQIETVASDDTNDYQLETWDMMEKCDVPVVICNQIYVTNQTDIDTWANEAGYQKAAEAYYQAIKNYYGIEK